MSLGQNNGKNYIESFPVFNTKKTMILGEVLNVNTQKMNESDAVKYVYNGDTSKLYINEAVLDGETGELLGKTINKRMPNRCFCICYETGFVVGYTFFESDSNGIQVFLCGRLDIYDVDYVKKDSLCVKYVDEYEDYIESYYNPNTNKIFISDIRNEKALKSIFYNINMLSHKFEKIKEYTWNVGMPIKQQLKYLELENEFCCEVSE